MQLADALFLLLQALDLVLLTAAEHGALPLAD